MKNFLKIFLIGFFLIQQSCFCQDIFLEKFKSYRSSMYPNLHLSASQKEKISKTDEEVFKKLSPHTQKISSLQDDLKNLVENEDLTIEKINKIKQEFDIEDEHISLIKKDYEKEFKQILTPKQKILYRIEKRKLRKNIKKEIKIIKKSASDNSN